MSKPKTCIRITGTRTGKLRARVERTITDGETKNVCRGDDGEIWVVRLPAGARKERFEVTIGGQKWYGLELQLRLSILCRARSYVNQLDQEIVASIHEFEAFEQSQGIQTPLDHETLGLRMETS